MRIDFHSHILPNMDDGASSIEESLELLNILSSSRVDKVVLTPHFYRQNEKIQAFLDRRIQSFQRLSEAASGLQSCPELILGAEVYFYPSLASEADLGKLCIENTNYILLELPFEHFNDNFYRSYANFLNNCPYKIILAHIERYLKFGNTYKDIVKLLDYGNVLCQMNCGSLAKANFFSRKQLLAFISDGLISAIGTDTHNLTHRPPLYSNAEKIIVNKCGKKAFDDICTNSQLILTDCEYSKIV